MEKHSKIYVAGHTGLVGSAIVQKLNEQGYTNIVTRSRSELDLLQDASVRSFFETEKPEYVFLAAARVGGIMANQKFPGQFIYENLTIQTHVIHHAYLSGVKKLLFLGSSCIYPKYAEQPIKESALMTGPLESTNASYATAKIAGIQMCQSYNREYGTTFISAMPTNLYGPNDHFDAEYGHVIPALIRKFHDAKLQGLDRVTLWGSGAPRREFLHVHDLAEALIFLMQHYHDSEIINVGTGEDISIRELAERICSVVGYSESIEWDPTKPNGTPKKQLDVSRLHTQGWKHSIELRKGIEETYAWYTSHFNASSASTSGSTN